MSKMKQKRKRSERKRSQGEYAMKKHLVKCLKFHGQRMMRMAEDFEVKMSWFLLNSEIPEFWSLNFCLDVERRRDSSLEGLARK